MSRARRSAAGSPAKRRKRGTPTPRKITTTPADLEAFLREATADGYPVDEIRFARCACGSEMFNVDVDENEGAARRTCASCEQEHLLCDSAEYWEDAEPEECQCPCKGEAFNLAVGFAFYAGSRDVKWIYLALRCVRCGRLGLYADWKNEGGPELVDQV